MLLLVSLELDIFRIKNSKKFSLGQFKYILDAILFTVTGTCEVQIYTVLVSTCIIYSDSFLIGVISIFPQAKVLQSYSPTECISSPKCRVNSPASLIVLGVFTFYRTIDTLVETSV